MRRFHFSLARTMAVIAVLAVDCALLVPGRFYPEMLRFVPVLQFGLFCMVPGKGRVRPYWVGFELLGWAGVLAWHLGLSRPMGRCFDCTLSHLVGCLSARHAGLFHLLGPIFDGEGLLMGAVAILLWGAVVCSPLVIAACLGGRLAAARPFRREADRA